MSFRLNIVNEMLCFSPCLAITYYVIIADIPIGGLVCAEGDGACCGGPMGDRAWGGAIGEDWGEGLAAIPPPSLSSVFVNLLQRCNYRCNELFKYICFIFSPSYSFGS